MAAPSNIRQISGTVPGVLDSTQSVRLLRLPGSRLHFAAFNPLAATAWRDVADVHKLSIKEELCRPRRIVIETSPGGDSFWRYVPRAHLEDGVEDEGEWPRAIIICGDMIRCSQDQWDMYKLDPLYTCSVRRHPHITEITRITNVKTTPHNAQRKRRASTPSPERSAPGPSRKKLRNDPDEDVDDASGENKGTVDEMIVDPLPYWNAMDGVYVPKEHHPEGQSSGRKANLGQGYVIEASEFFPADTIDTKKRKQPDIPVAPSIPDMSQPTYLREQRSSIYICTQNGKRARTVSPTRLDPKKQKRNRKGGQKESVALPQEKNMDFFGTPVAEARSKLQENVKEKHNEREPAQSAKDGEYLRQAAIDESRRKIAELEADKPLWEAAAKERMAREKEEIEGIRVRAGSSREKEAEEAERKARIIQEAEEKKRKEEQLHKEEASRRERERRQRQQQQWAFGPWTTQRALERYKILSEEFDSTKFCADLPLTTEAVPWPVLAPPARFNIADVDWEAVEKFFSGVRGVMGAQDYKTLVEKSHRRFHPDRWRSRSLLKTVLDEMERDNMEVAANTVAQAVTPLWRGLTGR